MILWKLVFFADYLTFGLWTPGYHLTINVLHALSAVALFLLLERYLAHRASAWIGALVWAAAGIGGWDNPLQWLMCGMIVLGIMWFLFAMACVSRCHGRNSIGWIAAMAICTALSLCSWGNMIALVPALPLQYFVLERQTPGSRANAKKLLFGWLVAFGLIGGWQLMLVLPYLNTPDRQRELVPLQIGTRSLEQMSLALGTLTFGRVVPIHEEPLLPKELLAAGMGVLIVAYCRGQRLKLVLVLLAVIAVNLALVNARGASASFKSAMTSGRYFYLPTLFWCVAAAALFDAVADRLHYSTPRHRQLITAALASLLALFIWHQHTVAAIARDYHDTVAARAVEQVATQQRLLQEFVNAGGRYLPDLPVQVENPSHMLSLTSGFAAICRIPDVVPRGIVPVDLMPERDALAGIAAVGRLSAPGAQEWSALLARSYLDFAALAWLSNFAVEKKLMVRLPRSWYKYGEIKYPVDQCLAWGFSRPLPGIVAVDAKQIASAELRELGTQLEQSTEPLAQYWIKQIQRAVQ